MEKFNNIAMEQAIEESKINLNSNFKNGGPFGAAIVKDGEIISTAHNTVLESKDATAHAEINAIRKASKKLNTHDLSRMHIIHKCRTMSNVFICNNLGQHKRSLLCKYKKRCR